MSQNGSILFLVQEDKRYLEESGPELLIAEGIATFQIANVYPSRLGIYETGNLSAC